MVEKFNGMTFSGGLGTEWLVSEIAEELRAVQEETQRALVKIGLEDIKEVKREVFERAAEIADSCGCTDKLMNMACIAIAERIRKEAGEL